MVFGAHWSLTQKAHEPGFVYWTEWHLDISSLRCSVHTGRTHRKHMSLILCTGQNGILTFLHCGVPCTLVAHTESTWAWFCLLVRMTSWHLFTAVFRAHWSLTQKAHEPGFVYWSEWHSRHFTIISLLRWNTEAVLQLRQGCFFSLFILKYHKSKIFSVDLNYRYI